MAGVEGSADTQSDLIGHPHERLPGFPFAVANAEAEAETEMFVPASFKQPIKRMLYRKSVMEMPVWGNVERVVITA